MQYTPREEKEIRSNMLLSPGEYDFEIVSATEKTSKAGNDMIELQVRVFPGDDSSPRLLKDWLVAGSDLGELKINRFAHATGLQDEYFAGNFTGLTCEGATGKLRITVQSSAQYGDQNSVRDYVPPRAAGEDETSQLGVPTQQTKRAMKKAQDGNKALADAGYAESDIPF